MKMIEVTLQEPLSELTASVDVSEYIFPGNLAIDGRRVDELPRANIVAGGWQTMTDEPKFAK